MRWTDAFSTTPDLARALGDAAHLKAMLAFEAALAEAEAEEGLIPKDAARIVAANCFDLKLDQDSLFAQGAVAGTLAIPLVKRLTEAVRAESPAAAGFVHFGATSQDVVDTATVLQLREAAGLIRADLVRAANAAAALAEKHRRTVMLGRTLLQPATPITFGLKAAQWLASIVEAMRRFDAAARDALRLQFGGAAGSLGALGDKGPAVSARMAAKLGLEPSLLPWHVRRGALVAFATSAAIALGALAKIARDVALMMQLEVAECFEPAEAGRGGSSAMPHKRNPVRCMAIAAAHQRAPHLAAQLIAGMAQEHERALGAWQAEWSAVPELFALAGGAASHAAVLLEGLVVDAAKMRANLDALNGLPLSEAVTLALAPPLGRDEAHRIVAELSRRVIEEGATLAALAASDPRIAAHLDDAQRARLADPAGALGATDAMIDAALALWRGR